MVARALVVIDAQNEYDFGRLPISHPPLDESVRRIGRAMDAARRARIPVVVVRHTLPAAAPVFAVGSPEWQLHPVVAERHADVIIDKTLPGAFSGTPLEQWLRDHDVDTVTCTGYMTQHCVSMTARQAMHAGFAAEVLSDATGTLAYRNEAGAASAEEMHRVHLAALHATFAAVATTDEWLDAVANGTALPLSDPVRSAEWASVELR
jgi:nicotinamidase-related amidase